MTLSTRTTTTTAKKTTMMNDAAHTQCDDGETVVLPINIMTDPRVYRGIALGRRGAPQDTEAVLMTLKKEKEKRQKRAASRLRRSRKRLPTISELHEQTYSIKSKNKEVPLWLYLEEQDDVFIERTMESSQTDAFLELPPPGAYVPAKIGMNASTQIDSKSGDLFLFEVAVEPIVSVIVGKSMEQALMEVRQELEIKSLLARNKYSCKLEADRQVGFDELESRETMLLSQKKSLIEAKRVLLEAEDLVQLKIKSRKLAQNFLSTLQNDVLQCLEHKKFICNPTAMDIEENFIPYMLEQVNHHFEAAVQAQHFADEIIYSAMTKGVEAYRTNHAAAVDRLAEMRTLNAQRKLEVRLFLLCDLLGDKPVGPVIVRNGQSVTEALNVISQWLALNAPEQDLSETILLLKQGEYTLPLQSTLMELDVKNMSTLTLIMNAAEN